MAEHEFRTGRFAISLFSAFALIGGILGAVSGMLVIESFPVLSPKRSAALFLCGMAIFAASYFRREKEHEQGQELLPAFSIAAIVWGVVFIFSEVIERRFVFYPGAQVRDQVAAIAVCTTLVIGVVLASGRKPKIPGGESILLLCQIVAAISFLQCAQGRLLFSDDHPSFLYRFQELVHHFPSIPYYNIDWNGGYVAREFFATGAIGSFILFSPFIAAVGNISTYDGARVYSLIVPYLFVFLVPCSVYLASRLFGLSRTASSVAGVLALGPSLGYFEWILKYGTIGFALSAGLLPLVTVLAFRLGLAQSYPDGARFLPS